MDANDQVIPFPLWNKMVRDTIHDDYRELIESTDCLDSELEDVLLDLHERYRPQENGVWNASPCWTDMFKWTACPLKKVKAVILLKSPKPIDAFSDFESTGFSAGVKRKDGYDHQSIMHIKSVSALMDLGYLCVPKPDGSLPAIVEKKYQGGFNPECLSGRGILFLNVALTRGRATDENNTDVVLWQHFILGLLARIPAENTPLFQWYLTSFIDYKLKQLAKLGKYAVSKPRILRLAGPYYKHICYLTDTEITDYAMEIRASKNNKHKKILEKIYKSMVCESNVQTYYRTQETA